ncbi:monocarboxylate transporter 12-like [Belonocnema kinseyi]|uniref:monocarboxylate transporter 12-like n=1 Tax=Belonocnema kinseyi TaxID=2817044 RepID=UPI00143DFDBF|nr:monocarboxylate transporter 12-like [Belonocnema kinseyi]
MKKILVKKAIPPDGGWGWLICLGCSLITLSLRSLDPSFGLLFGDLLQDLKVDSTRTSMIMSILDANINFSGLFIGFLLRKYSYRKVAFLGSILNTTGLILTSQANSLTHIILTYSILGGLGSGLALASSFVAMNSFFLKKRGQALGFSMAGTTLGMMLMPQLVHLLLNIYGFRGTTLIIGAISFHSLTSENLDATSKENEPLIKETKKQENIQISLDLLSNLTFLNIMIGLSLFYAADTNFKLFTPFFLSSIGMEKKEVAFCLSLTAFMDILARLVLPTLCDKLGFKKRYIFWISSLFIGLGRSVFAEGSNDTFLLVVLVIIGFIRGASIVNLNLTISESCSLEMLPHAFGIFMIFKGTLVILISPLVGYVRDIADSYEICIHLMTGLIFLSFIIWGVEFFYKKVNLFLEKRRNFSGLNKNYRTFY